MKSSMVRRGRAAIVDVEHKHGDLNRNDKQPNSKGVRVWKIAAKFLA